MSLSQGAAEARLLVLPEEEARATLPRLAEPRGCTKVADT